MKAGDGDRVCFFWEGNDEGVESVTTYKQLLDQVCQVRAGPSVGQRTSSEGNYD